MALMDDEDRPIVKSVAEFEALSAYEKGYAIYMLGNRGDEPHVPKTYEPRDGERVEYERGQQQATQDTQDGEE